MIGWLIFLLLALALLLPLVWIGKLDRGQVMLVGSALFVAAAGYAWQGRPGLSGAPFQRDELRPATGNEIFSIERQRFLNKYGETGQVLATSDSFGHFGLSEAAAGLLRNAVAKHPRDVDLRIGYAHALLVQAGGHFAPAVQLAFDRAITLAPSSPTPRYFLGLAHLEAGDAQGAETVWRALSTSLPANSPWQGVLSERLAMFDMLRRMDAARQGSAAR